MHEQFDAREEAEHCRTRNSFLNQDPTVMAEWAYSPSYNTVAMRYPHGKNEWRIPNTSYPMYRRENQIDDWISVGLEEPIESTSIGHKPRVKGYEPRISYRILRMEIGKFAWRWEATVDNVRMAFGYTRTKQEAENKAAGMIEAYTEAHYIIPK